MAKYRNGLKKDTGHRSLAFYLISVFGCLLIVGIGVVCFRLRGGVQVKASQDMGMQSEAEAVLYRQDDERWGENKLGDSKDTMRSSGCLVSCIASALSMESGEEETPGSLNKKFSDKRVYDTEGNLQWQLLAEGEEYRVDVYEEVSTDIIDACLSQGHYPIVRVRMYALGNIHYVLILGARGGKYLCMDPLRDEITELSDYGSRVYAVRCVYYDERNSERGGKDGTAESEEDADSADAENLQDFQDAMARREENISFQSIDALPFSQEMEMKFCHRNEAGDWRTILKLKPDGSFTGHYSDFGGAGEDYPCGTLYVCDFHGKFGEIKQISDASFSMTLEELVTDTGQPPGEERIEDGWLYVSGEPFGLVGEDGKALKPGTTFLFYTPDATGHEPGTELYGAVEFLSWSPVQREFSSGSDRLNCYALHNLETGYGFFSAEGDSVIIK